jgi:hypothetical protein
VSFVTLQKWRQIPVLYFDLSSLAFPIAHWTIMGLGGLIFGGVVGGGIGVTLAVVQRKSLAFLCPIMI